MTNLAIIYSSATGHGTKVVQRLAKAGESAGATTSRPSSARSAFTTGDTSPQPSAANPARQQRETTSPCARRVPDHNTR